MPTRSLMTLLAGIALAAATGLLASGKAERRTRR